MLFFAGVLEVAWAFAMKQSDGFTRPLPTTVMVVTMIGSIVFLALAMRSLPLGTAYSIWTGIGAVGAFVAGIVFLGESATLTRIFAVALIVSGLIVMRLAEGK
jgi:quaternary ammonium compound-resistance protein SugE